MQKTVDEYLKEGKVLLYQQDGPLQPEKLNEAIKNFDQALKLEPQNINLKFYKAFALYKSAKDSNSYDLSQSLTLLDDLIEKNMNFTSSFFLKALVLHRKKYDTNYYDSIKNMDVNDEEGYYIKVLAKHQILNSKDYESEANIHEELLLKVNVNENFDAFEKLMSFMQKSNPVQALIKINDFIKIHPNVILGYKIKAQLCTKTEDLNTAISALETWCTLIPKSLKKYEYDNPFSQRIKAHLKQKQVDFALKAADEWLLNTPMEKQALKGKFNALNELSKEKYEKLLEFVKKELIIIDVDKFFEANGFNKMTYYQPEKFKEELDEMISYPLLEIHKNLLCSDESITFCDRLELLKNHEELIANLDFLYKKSKENPDFYSFYLRFLNLKACLLIYNKRYKEAKECLEFEFSETEEYNKKEKKPTVSFIFQNYCLSKICLLLNEKKEAFLYSEAMAYLEAYQANDYMRFPTIKYLWKNFPLLRKEIFDENMAKEIRNTKRKEVKTEVIEILEKVFALTFNGQVEDYKKALEFINEGLKIEVNSTVLNFYQLILKRASDVQNINLILLTQLIRNDIGFLPLYYLKNYICYYYKEYKSSNKLLKPLEQEDFFIKAFLPLEVRKTTSKHSLENLENCHDKRFERKVLDLKRVFYEKTHNSAQALSFSKLYFEKYPNFTEMSVKIFINLINDKNFDEAIDVLEKIVTFGDDNNLFQAFKTLSEHIENQSFSLEGFKLKWDTTKISKILQKIVEFPKIWDTTLAICFNLQGAISWYLNENLSEALELFQKSVKLDLGYQNQRNQIYHTNICKVANLLQQTNLAIESCQKAFGVISSSFNDDKKPIRKIKKAYYKKILLEEAPKLYNEEFLKRIKERKTDEINENSKANYQKALEAFHWKGRYSNPRENEAYSLISEEMTNDDSSFMLKFQKIKFYPDLLLIDELISIDPYYIGSYYLKLKKISHSFGQSAKPDFYYKLMEKFEPNENDMESLYQIGSYHESNYRYDEAFKYYIKLPIYYIDAYTIIVQHYSDMEDQEDKMFEVLDLLIKAYPNLEWAYQYKTEKLKGKSMMDLIDIWAKQFPESELLQEFLECRYNIKQDNGCLERLQMCYKYFPNSSEGTRNLMKAIELFVYGEKGLELAKLTLLTTEELLKLSENDKRSWGRASTDNFQGNLLMILGRYEEASKCYERISDSTCALYQCNRGLVFLKLNKITSAFPAFEKAYSALQNKNISFDIDSSNPNPGLEKYIKETIINERKHILSSLIDDINKHSIVLDDVKGLGEKVQKLERQMTLKNIDSGNEVLKDLKLVTEKIKENDKSVEKLNKEKVDLLKIVEETEKKQSGFIELTSQVENWKTKADKFKDEKDKLENQYKSLEEKVNLLFKNMDSVNTKVEKIDSNVQQTNQKVEEIEKVQQKEEKILEKHENALNDGGVYAKIEVKKGFLELESQDIELYAYCKTFYWTMLNYFGGYRNISTDLLKKNVDIDEGMKNKVLVEGLKKAAEVGKEIAKGIPFVGSVIGGLDKVVDIIYGKYKEKKFDYKVKIVNLFIQKKFIMEEDISLDIGKLAIDMAKLRKEEIYQSVKENKFNKVWNWLNDQMNNLSKMVFPYLEINNEKGAKLALKDVVAFFAYLFKNHEEVIENQENLSKQFQLIIKYGSLENLLREAQLENQNKTFEEEISPEKNQEFKTKKTCKCNIF